MLIAIEKAEKGQPYIWLCYEDGTRKLQTGTITNSAQRYGLLHVNRFMAINRNQITQFTKKFIHVQSGEKFKIPRRKLKWIESELKKTAV